VAAKQQMSQTLMTAVQEQNALLTNTMDEKDRALEIGMIQNMLTALQGRLSVLQQ